MKRGNTSTHQALYRKYRSHSLGEIAGQSHITDTLAAAIKQGNISHAYLFSGPRGVGKTSIARILAHQINDLPYDGTQTHLDIIEIDAASNRRIDDIRDLRSKVNIAPTQAKYKVYIIDEVHMLTKESFNALLKTLEEPPSHAVFILATTEPHKLPATIISRTQHYQFKPIKLGDITSHLSQIAKTEKIDIDDEALRLVAERASGGMRDALSMLDQLAGLSGKIDLTATQQFLGISTNLAIESILDNVESHNLPEVITAYQDTVNQGADINSLTSQLHDGIKQRLLTAQASANLTKLMNDLLTVPSSYDPTTTLEAVLLKNTVNTDKTDTPAVQPTNPPAPKSPKPSVKPKKVNKTTQPVEEVVKVGEKTPAHSNTAKDAAKSNSLDAESWDKFLDIVRPVNSTLLGLLKQVVAEYNDGVVVLYCPYSFHVKRLETDKYQQIMRQTFTEVLVDFTDLNISQDSERFTSKKAAQDAINEAIMTDVQAIMGGEVINV